MAEADRIDEAFLDAHTIDLTSHQRQRDRLREELTLDQIDRHVEAEEIDVTGILAFAERVLPRVADLSGAASLDQKQRLQQLSFRTGSRSTGTDSIEPAQPRRSLGT